MCFQKALENQKMQTRSNTKRLFYDKALLRLRDLTPEKCP